MIRSLRKGNTTVELWYKFGSESISAIETEVELMPDHAVFRTKLKPVDDNQKMDADNVFENDDSGLFSVSLQDRQIYDVASRFLGAYHYQINYVALEVFYKKLHKLSVSLELRDDEELFFTVKQ